MDSSSFVLLVALTEDPAVSQPFVSWMVNALGSFYALLIPLEGVIIFGGACVVVTMKRRPAVIATYLVFVPIPFLTGVYASSHGLISGCLAIADFPGTIRLTDLALFIANTLSASLVGLVATFPAYSVTAIGLFLRTNAPKESEKAPG